MLLSADRWHPYAPTKASVEVIFLAEMLSLKHMQQIHIADLTEFLKELKGKKLSSIEGIKIVRGKTLEALSLCVNLHLEEGKKIVRGKTLEALSLCKYLHFNLDPLRINRTKTGVENCPNLSEIKEFPIVLP